MKVVHIHKYLVLLYPMGRSELVGWIRKIVSKIVFVFRIDINMKGPAET
jgi:hypothetical protein